MNIVISGLWLVVGAIIARNRRIYDLVICHIDRFIMG